MKQTAVILRRFIIHKNEMAGADFDICVGVEPVASKLARLFLWWNITTAPLSSV